MSPTIQHSKYFIILIFIFFVTIQTQQIVTAVKPCLQFNKGICTRCPERTELYQDQCYQIIQNCLEIQYGTASSACKTKLNTTFTSSSSIRRNVNQLTVGDPYYTQLTTQEAQNNPFFVDSNNFMINGQYGYFISQTSNPVRAVFQANVGQIKKFKILQEGIGGLLLMSMIDMDINTKVKLIRSFVVIANTYVIDECVDYDVTMRCARCRDGFHLDTGRSGDLICIQDIPGCLQYYNNICVKCRETLFLVQNRCISSCQALKDARSILFYGEYDLNQPPAFFQISRDYF